MLMHTYFALNHFLLKKHEQSTRALSLEETRELGKYCVLAHELLRCIRGQFTPKGLEDLGNAPSVAVREGRHGSGD